MNSFDLIRNPGKQLYSPDATVFAQCVAARRCTESENQETDTHRQASRAKDADERNNELSSPSRAQRS